MAFDKLKKGLGKLKNNDALLQLLQGTMDNNTVTEIRDGKVFVSSQLINDAIATRLSAEPDGPLAEVHVASHADGTLDISAATKDGKTVSLAGTIEKFVHNAEQSMFIYDTKSHKITGNLVASWIFPKLTLGFMRRFIGDEAIPDSIDVSMDGNIVTVNFSRLLAASRLGQATAAGIRPLDLLEIESATPRENGIELKTKLRVLDTAKSKLKTLLNS